MVSTETFYFNKMQEIISSPKGVVTHSNDTIVTLGTGHNIFDIHPFFKSLETAILASKEHYHTFPCVNLVFGFETFYCDVVIKRERGFLAILIFNYSKRYDELREKVQKTKGEQLKS